MEIRNALASLAVADLAAARTWYEQLLGPGSSPMPEVVEWQFPRGGGLQVYAGPERSGNGSCTIVVDDIDAITEHVRSNGLADDPQPQRSEAVDTLMIKDPAGNSIAFAVAHDASLAS